MPTDESALETPRPWLVPMRPRSRTETHRAATPLELFFDLVFVVAVAQAGLVLHHSLAEGRFALAVVNYFVEFFAIWWAWMNFTWFASAYDCDDVLYRLLVFGQLAGALILAAGVQRAFETGDHTIGVVGYVVMRLALVAQWLRAARADRPRRVTALRYAAGVTACQVGWVALLAVQGAWFHPLLFVGLGLAELAVPVWAERAGYTPWHPEHIAERYGLFTIIVLGESVLAVSLGIQAALASGELNGSVLLIVAGGLLILFAMWWFYFDWPMRGLLDSPRQVFLWGYGHLFIFGAGAAVGAGLAVEIDQVLHHAEIGAVAAGLTVVVPVALFALALWVLHDGPRLPRTRQRWLIPFMMGLVLLTPLIPGWAPLLTGLLLAGLLGVKLVSRYRTGASHA